MKRILCKIGMHKWIPWDCPRPRVEICERCEKFRHDGFLVVENGYKEAYGEDWKKELLNLNIDK